VLVRLIAPSLMDVHNDLVFWLGVACWPAAAVVAFFAGTWIYRDIRRHLRSAGDIVQLPRRPRPKDRS
jgi:hypothetical protein